MSTTKQDRPLHERPSQIDPIPAEAGRVRRIALYSHDTMGIGHLRRNLLIAQALRHAPCPTASLIIAGTCEVALFPMPSGTACLTLPPVQKQSDGSYVSRSLGVSLNQLIDVRMRAIDAALNAFHPDVVIVDKFPRGVECELDLALQTLKSRRRTKFVLGLRDVLDNPTSCRREWQDAKNQEIINTFYDAIWVYGDAVVYDTVREYSFPRELSAKTVYTGYLGPRDWRDLPATTVRGSIMSAEPPANPFVLCLVGGGQDGAHIVDAVSQAELPKGMIAVVLLGPFTAPHVRRRLHHRAYQSSRLHVLDFVTDPERFIARADRIVAMGGYNTICEVLAFDKPALIVPRVKPRQEQLIRAQRLHEMGLIDLLSAEQLSHQAISEWLAKEPERRSLARDTVDMSGTLRIPQLLADLLDEPDRAFERSQSTLEDTQFVDR